MMRSQNHRTNINTANASVRKLRKVKPSERKSMAFLLVLLDPRAPLGPSRARLRSGNKRRLDCRSHDHPPRGADFHHLRAGGERAGERPTSRISSEYPRASLARSPLAFVRTAPSDTSARKN